MPIESAISGPRRRLAPQAVAAFYLAVCPFAPAEEPAPAEARAADYERLVKPFLKEHCWDCHGDGEGMAGFRVDRLSSQLASGESSDGWLEVMDQINLGAMPPEEMPRPDADRAFAVTRWIADGLRESERAARSTGGQHPMRRLNRREYANTVRDLLQLDPKLLAPIVEDLPADGKAEGFDRLSAGLFFDRTQIEQSLAVAERIADLAIVNAAPPPRQSLTWQPEEAIRPPDRQMRYTEFSGVDGHRVEVGPAPLSVEGDGVRFVDAVGNRNDGPFQRMCRQTPDLAEIVTQDGWYRVRLRAGADAGRRREPVRVRMEYSAKTPLAASFELAVEAPLDDPQVIEHTVFLRSAAAGERQKLNLSWTTGEEVIRPTAEHQRHARAVKQARGALRQAVAGGNEPEIARRRQGLAQAQQEAAGFRGPAYELAQSLDRVPRLFIDWLTIDGPYPSGEAVYEPEVNVARFEAEAGLRDEGFMGIRPPRPTEDNRFVVDEKVEIPSGPPTFEVREEDVLFRQGGPTYRKDDPWGRLATVGVQNRVPEDGYYRVRVRCGADPGTRGEPVQLAVAYNFKTPQEKIVTVDALPTLDDPDIVEATLFLRRGADDQKRTITLLYSDLRDYIVSTPTFNQLFQDTNGTVSKMERARAAGDDAEVQRLTAFLAEARKRARAWEGPVRHVNPEHADVQPPRLLLDWMEFEGPLQEQWPPASHRAVLFDGDERQDLAYAREIVAKLLPRAFRRPVEPREIDGVMGLIQSSYEETGDFHASLRMGLTRILVSPGFLFLNRPAPGEGNFDQFALASRLSYFLWNTMPDEELTALAAEGRLDDDAVLRGQVERMLADPRSRALTEGFGAQWLGVNEFGTVMPADQYRDYDSELEEASKQEALAFFAEVLNENLPITTFLDSDFVMINERLARHYDIEGVEGAEIRRVAIGPEAHRGGVLGMAGLMTLLADGTRTLPVRRANWALATLFNDPSPPPPPNAGEVQPNAAGENLTVRERLELHRDEATCASCHRSLDPYGLALENYDAIGKWRTQANGEDFRGRNRPELDVSGTLPGGHAFTSLEEFKAGLMAQRGRFARAFAERLLTYALARPLGYGDRETVDALVAELESDGDRIRSLIHGIVQSDAFRVE
ncbi:DUF1592 domain-containing protein [Alienimonas chondri]|uniref:DUF1592 domain-containing protein n=1 Tax=Alienimonas chondri TaxID=2681879 RepID=A0ABX1V8B2_9PLAN|nr:DUF1592 domain-containing protein [Alienimonas chondri]NNJ24285.1 hypothetical protein [Alienimonas chondri]